MKGIKMPIAPSGKFTLGEQESWIDPHHENAGDPNFYGSENQEVPEQPKEAQFGLMRPGSSATGKSADNDLPEGADPNFYDLGKEPYH